MVESRCSDQDGPRGDEDGGNEVSQGGRDQPPASIRLTRLDAFRYLQRQIASLDLVAMGRLREAGWVVSEADVERVIAAHETARRNFGETMDFSRLAQVHTRMLSQ